MDDRSLNFRSLLPFFPFTPSRNCDGGRTIDKKALCPTLLRVNLSVFGFQKGLLLRSLLLAQAIVGISLMSGMANDSSPTDRSQPIVYDAKGHIVEGPVLPETPQTLPEGVGTISLEQALAWQSTPGVVFVDARGENSYVKGHIPGALQLGQRSFEKDYPAVEALLRSSTKIVIYCTSRQCDDSVIVANKLTALGYRNLFLFEGGWAEWWKYHRKKQP